MEAGRKREDALHKQVEQEKLLKLDWQNAFYEDTKALKNQNDADEFLVALALRTRSTSRELQTALKRKRYSKTNAHFCSVAKDRQRLEKRNKELVRDYLEDTKKLRDQRDAAACLGA